jgi:PAS domain S-box-containing protein
MYHIKILAIDYKADNLFTISALLKNIMLDCVVITAQSGQEGIEKSISEMPDTIILDVKMPGMDGFETCRRLKEQETTKHIPVILLTAIRTDMDSRIRGLELGADAFLTKPIDETELVAQINVMLRIKKAEDLLRSEKDMLENLVTERTRELSESLKKLRKEKDFVKSLEDASPAYYVALDHVGNVITMNRSMLEVLGYQLAEVKGKKYFSEFVQGDERERVTRNFQSVIVNRKETVHESTIVTRDRVELIVEWHGRPFLGIEGNIDFIFFVGIDMTERRRLEKIIMTASEEERHRIGQNLHDGLGQHLAGIALKSEILKLKLREKGIEDPGDIADIIELVNQAIDKTRDLAKGLFPVDASGGGLYSAFEDLRQNVEKVFAISCLLNFDERISFQGDLETSNVYYIVKEAVNNAIKHGKPRNIIITAVIDGDLLVIKITDDGIGIPDDIENRRGMGINIMNYRAWLIGATLDIRKNDGGGSTVTCAIKYMGKDVSSSAVEEKIRNRYLAVDGGNKSRVLLVDDHPIVRQGLTQIINMETDLVVCGEASNASDAMRLIASTNPHLVIADISMQGTSGLEFAKALKTRYPGLPVLILSIHDEALYAERAIRVGARGYVMKQEAPQTVVTAIRTVLAGKQYLNERVKERIIDSISCNINDKNFSPLDCLTDREFEIFQLIGRGMQNRNIADKLQISVKTVENFRDRIKNKLNIESSPELVQFAVNWVIENKG